MTPRRCQGVACRGVNDSDGITLLKPVQAARLGGNRAHCFVIGDATLCGSCARSADKPPRAKARRRPR